MPLSDQTISKTKLMMYLADLQLTYSPVDIDSNGRWVGGDEKLYLFVKGLAEELDRWED